MPTLEEIKTKQQMTWSSGDYSKVAWQTVPLADALVEAVDLRPESTVLDVATGTGHVALAASRRFGETTGVDYVPAFIEMARRRAEAEGLPIRFDVGDAEALEFPDGSFDYVLSAIGVMFTANQEKAASELLRVCKSGGTIGMVNWTPPGFVGQMFKTISAHVPPPPGVKPPGLWGTEERLGELFGDDVSSLSIKPGSLTWRFRSPEHYADFFITNYGPTLKAYETVAEDKKQAFRDDLIALAERFNRAGNGSFVSDWDYVTVVATKA